MEREKIMFMLNQCVEELANLVIIARCGGAMQAPMKSTTFSCLVCL